MELNALRKTICIDCGHGAGATGAIFKGHYEKDIVLLVGLCMRGLLEPAGYEVVMTRSRDSFVGLQERCDIANRAKADIFVSLHTNADPDEDRATDHEAKGEEIWVYSTGYDLARSLREQVDTIFPAHKFRGIKQSSRLKVLRDTNMPAVLLELGFIDNIEELKGLTHSSSYYRIASLLVKGLRSYFNDY